METGICTKCGSSFIKKRNFDAPVEDYLCQYCIEEWYKFYDEKNGEFNTDPKYKWIKNPTWEIFLGRLSTKEVVEFT
jgi:hypothetical protein